MAIGARLSRIFGLRKLGRTPGGADPKLAASVGNRGLSLTDFKFTPSAAKSRPSQVRVAIRARPDSVRSGVADAGSASPVTALTPASYNLGAAVGWRRFAISGDVAQNDSGLISGVRESARVGISYQPTRRLTGRVAVGAERAEGAQRIIAEDEAYSLDVGGAYRIGRNIDVTAGARYRISRDRLDPMSRDDRRDSQAVYIGTAFRF